MVTGCADDGRFVAAHPGPDGMVFEDSNGDVMAASQAAPVMRWRGSNVLLTPEQVSRVIRRERLTALLEDLWVPALRSRAIAPDARLPLVALVGSLPAHMRNIPAEGGTVMEILSPGARVHVIERSKHETRSAEGATIWYRIRTKKGTGWVPGTLLETERP